MRSRPTMDALYFIRARLDTGRDKGAKQLNKDIRALKKAEEEIVRLREWIERDGIRNNTCTFDILKKICLHCECKRNLK